MFRKKIILTRPDRDRLLQLTGAGSRLTGWAMFAARLRSEIDRARVVDEQQVDPDVVTMHSTVRMRDSSRQTDEVFTLVYPEEADLSKGTLSVLTPLGTALIGERAGNVIQVSSADGPRAIQIQSVVSPEPSAGASARV